MHRLKSKNIWALLMNALIFRNVVKSFTTTAVHVNMGKFQRHFHRNLFNGVGGASKYLLNDPLSEMNHPSHHSSGTRTFMHTDQFNSRSVYTRKVHQLHSHSQSQSHSQSSNQSIELEISTIEDMEDVGAVLSMGTEAGDVFLLDGDLGAGKTCFSRGFVRERTGAVDIRVTSPTYLLSNTYPTGDGDLLIHHMDLYRLSGDNPEEMDPLNFDFVLNKCISLIEWPSRLGELVPPQRLEITFRIDPETMDDSEENTRYLILSPYGSKWEKRLEELKDSGYLDDMIVEYEDEDDNE